MNHSETSLLTSPRANLAAALTACALLCLPSVSHAHPQFPGVFATGHVLPEPFSGRTFDFPFLAIGVFGPGTMTIGPGGRVVNSSSYIGSQPYGVGYVIVDGGLWRTDTLVMGYATARGSLVVRRNGKVAIDHFLEMGDGGLGYSEALVRVEEGGEIEAKNVRTRNYDGSYMFTLAGGTLRLTGNQPLLFDGFKAGEVTLAYGPGTIDGGGTIDTQGFDVSTNHGLEGQGSLIKVGSGTLTLTGSNTYTGGTTVNQGTLSVSGNGSISHHSSDLNVFGVNATLSISGSSAVNNRDGIIDGPGFPGGTATVSGGTWANSGILSVGRSGTGSLSLSGGTVSNTDGFIGFDAGSNGTVTVSGGNWTNTGFLRVGWHGTGNLNLGSGTVSSADGAIATLANSIGTATVSGGNWTNSSFLSVGRVGIGSLILSNGTVSNTEGYLGAFAGASGTATVTGGTWTNSSFLMVGQAGTGSLNLSGGAVSASFVSVGDQFGGIGTVNLTGGILATGQVSKGLGTGTVTFNGGTLRLTSDQADLFSGFEAGDVSLVDAGGTIHTQGFAVASAAGLSGNGSLTKQGGGAFILTGTNTYTGDTRIENGTLALSGSGTLSSLTTVTVDAGGIFNLGAANGSRAIGSLAGGGDVTLGANGLSTGGNSATTIFSGVISGTGSLTKEGTGTQFLSGPNAYTGGTTVAAGALRVNGSIGSVTVSTSGTLGGDGTVGAISLNGGDLSPGNSAGTLSAESLEWNTGGIVFDLGGDASTSDLLALSGSLTGSGGPKLFTFLNSGWVIGNTYNLIGFGTTSLSIGQFGFTNMEGFEGNFAFNGNVLQFTVVPEPGTWAVLIVVCLAIALRRRWRRA